jgi:hypothetical protein
LKAHQNDLKIPCLPETATDEEIEAARETLCKLQEMFRESQKKYRFHSKLLYDRYNAQKREKSKGICRPNDPGSFTEENFEEISKSIMKDLSLGKKNIVSDHILLTRIA